jgi:hypothetical protein
LYCTAGALDLKSKTARELLALQKHQGLMLSDPPTLPLPGLFSELSTAAGGAGRSGGAGQARGRGLASLFLRLYLLNQISHCSEDEVWDRSSAGAKKNEGDRWNPPIAEGSHSVDPAGAGSPASTCFLLLGGMYCRHL